MLQPRSSRFSTLYEPEFRRDGTLPLIFISQLSRSGGSMLSQLLDGIPEILAYPRELHLGVYKTKIPDLDAWCSLSGERAGRLFFEANKGLFDFASEGRYDKGTKRFLPFFLDKEAFTYIFERLWEETLPKRGRDVAAIFFTAFFTAWLDLQRPSNVSPSYISAFASWTAFSRANVARFFTYYPDGYLIQLIREPVAWYASVKALRMAGRVRKDLPIYQGLDTAIASYLKQAETMKLNIAAQPERCVIVDYGELVKNTRGTMTALCDFLGIPLSEWAFKTTFNRWDIGANSSFVFVQQQRDEILDRVEVQRLREEALPAYETAKSMAGVPSGLGERSPRRAP